MITFCRFVYLQAHVLLKTDDIASKRQLFKDMDCGEATKLKDFYFIVNKNRTKDFQEEQDTRNLHADLVGF